MILIIFLESNAHVHMYHSSMILTVSFLSPKIFAYSINHIFLIFRTFWLKMRNILPFEEMYIFRFMVFTTTIIFQLYLGNQFYWWRKPEYLEKTTNLLTTLEMIGTDCIGSCKFNYHTITTATAPYIFSTIFDETWHCQI